MLSLLIVAAVVFLFSAIHMFVELKNAPEGHQTNEEFTVWCNKNPQAANVVCVWSAFHDEDVTTEASEFSEAA